MNSTYFSSTLLLAGLLFSHFSFIGCDRSRVKAVPAGSSFSSSRSTTTPSTLNLSGKELYNKLGCAPCHSIDGKASLGPSLRGIYNKRVQLQNRKWIVRDANYLRRKIKKSKYNIYLSLSDDRPWAQATVIISYNK